MGSFLVVYAFDELWSLANIVRYGLLSLQHRGSQSYVVCVPGEKVVCTQGESIDEVSKEAFKNVTLVVIGNGSDDTPVETDNTKSIAVASERPWSGSDGVLQALAKALSDNGDLVKAFVSAVSEASSNAMPSLAVLTKRGEVIVWRSSSSLSPLVLGSYGFDMAIAASESVAIDILGGEVKRFLAPGEGMYIARHLLKRFTVNANSERSGLCTFEFLYLARHDAIIDGVSVYLFRKLLGKELAKHIESEVDVVVGVPETALPYAIGFAEAIEKPFEMAFVTTGGRKRSMLYSDPFEKLVAIHLKMNPIRSALEGKRIALIDDSMVTGSTIKTVSQILRFRVGVPEIHLFIASPPLVAQCPFNVMKLDMKSLLAANLSESLAKDYLEVDSLHWLSKEDVNGVVSRFGLKLCGRCFGVVFFGCGK
jgi:amidophosphoribosyltransferase